MSLPSPIFYYNLLVQVYNSIDLQAEGPLMLVLQHSSLYDFVYLLQTHTTLRILFLLTLLTPPLNLLSFVLCVFALLFYTRQRSIVTLNKLHVQDPLKRMSFEPSFCGKLDVYFAAMPRLKDTGLFINPELPFEHIDWIYGEHLNMSQHLFDGALKLHLIWVSTAGILVGASGTLLLAL